MIAPMQNRLIAIAAGFLWFSVLPNPARPGSGAVIGANPSNYRAVLSTLRAGDTLQLTSGTYPRLAITGLNGTADAWITISGPSSGSPAVILGAPEYNTVEILNSSYVAIENLRIDSRGIPGAFGISARGKEENLTHHIRIERNMLVGQNGGQQTVGISTKTPTWGWIIRFNQILGAGTGLYLGDSDGTQPFLAGLIEHNLIKDTIGYNMQIKHQTFLPSVSGMPAGPTTTTIRHNVFIKNDQPSPDGDRPNLLLGGSPSTGPGSLNMYEVYGNYFVHNHREALFQGAGRLSLHDNVFVDGPYAYPAVVLRSQINPLKIAYVYNNTVYTEGRGIYFGTRAEVDDAVVGNLVFALTPISGTVMRQSDNLVAAFEDAPKYLKSPSLAIGSMDFYPLPGKCQGAPIDLSLFQTNTEYNLDFNGTPKTEYKGVVAFRGAYAGEAANPGWQLAAGVKPPPPSPSSVPSMVWITPATGRAGTSVPVTLTGTNFLTGATVTVSGTGVTVGQATVSSPTQITATFTIAANAPPGARDVAVNQTSTSSNALPFRVSSR